ncbi:flagellar hook capping FlgD N-terminal domain-containing protein [Paeniglutamicibacter kerguelensis]|uniref:Flagellar basal-body rod modification protein FlgD n=1 Tax=Paeniglutamicibacter kerguelensis TaxID=254788 RepID=A0ABS4XEG0_9MICC|nr:flagellar hook capping FlgD N-terminal domain-containing protein [Paeniglutamicibacter kerguelensis]MBP2386849.1 flagellar basal-body rod modification protein FlgD [Paeniglutamicibacter kerguelensis]
MPIAPIDVTQFGTGNQPVRAPKQSMDGEVFMHLLVTQLANQDPSSPMDTNDMIAQTTQLASMERLNMLGATQDVSLAIQQRTAVSALLGQKITTGGDEPVTGVVTAVSFAGVEPVVTVDGKQIPYSHIVSIAAVPTEPPPPEDTGESTPDPEPEHQPAAV